MDFSHYKNDPSPVLVRHAAISCSSAIDNEQGDVFQCGRCKSTFFTLIEFLYHKKDHMPPTHDQHLPSELVIVGENNVIGNTSFVEPSNQIWLWNPDTVVNGENEIEVTTQPLNPKYYESSGKISLYNVTDSRGAVTKDNECSQLTYNDPENKLSNECNSAVDKSNVMKYGIDKPPEEVLPGKEIVYYCEVCHKYFTKHSDLLLHARSHTGEKPFQCNICGRTFSQKSNLNKHVPSHRVWPDGLPTVNKLSDQLSLTYSCSFCCQNFNQYQHFKVHMKEHHHKKMYKCIQEKCNEMFDDVISLMSHIKVKHSIVKYHCHLCDTSKTSLDDISHHLATHKSATKCDNKFYCIHCRAAFKRRIHLSHHLDTANHNNKCNHCDKVYARERDLRRHLRVKHNEMKRFKCDICQVTFGSKTHLSSHILTHTKQKLFTCAVCDVKFSRKDILCRHIKKHQPNKKIPCPFKAYLDCKMEFTRNDKLKLHIKSHINKMKGENRKKHVTPKKPEEEKSTIEIIIVDLSEKN